MFFFLLHSLAQSLPRHLCEVTRLILKTITAQTTSRVDLVFDIYVSPSIKDVERSARGEANARSFFFGPAQTTPNDFKNLLKLSTFKVGIAQFLFEDLANQDNADLIGNKTIYCAVNHKCVCIKVVNGIIHSEEVLGLAGRHEEADTRVVFHTVHSIKEGYTSVTVRANGTDILIILLASCHAFINCNVFMDVGFSYNNSRRLIDVTRLFNKLGTTSEALPGLHAFTGCDYNPCFNGKGKQKPLKLMCQSQKFIDAFRLIGSGNYVLTSVQNTIEEFTCRMYGFKTLCDINKARYESFCSKYKPDPGATSPLSKIKSVDPSLFPPCRKVLLKQTQRANLIAAIWRNACLSNPSEHLNPVEHGWLVQDGKFSVEWFDGDQVPPQEEVFYENSEFSQDDEDDGHASEEEESDDDSECSSDEDDDDLAD